MMHLIRNSLKSNWFWFCFATIVIIFSFTIFAPWAFLVLAWFSFFLIFRFTKLELKLADTEQFFYWGVVIGYPLLETAIKWAIVKDMIPYSWFWLNRLEHFCWAIATTILFLPVVIDLLKRLPWWQGLIFVLGLICILGNINEFLEYGLRYFGSQGAIAPAKAAAYYWDTIYDMMINAIGGLVGFIIISFKTRAIGIKRL